MSEPNITPEESVPEQPRRPWPPRQRPDDDYTDIADRARHIERDDAVSTLIPYKNPKALLAYYLGVFSLIPCVGAALGPTALILGILGLSYVNTHPTAKGTGHAIAGIVLGGLVTLGYVALLAFVVIGAATAK
jgi:hypothetical protein